jgi:hypothetical protein
MSTIRNLRFLTLPFLAVLALAVPSMVGAAKAVKPSAGDYEAQPVKIDGNYQFGAFAVVNEGGKRRIVSSELYQGIFYPDLGECESFNLPLVTESIPISATGRFSVRERTPAEKDSVLVVWKGRWEKPKKVVGTLEIEYKSCSSKVKWVGRRTKPVL